MLDKQIRRRTHRLNKDLYRGEVHGTFTSCISDRRAIFTDDKIFETFKRILFNELVKHDCRAHVYLFMPDHLHLLIEGINVKSNLLKTVTSFKQKTGYWFSKNMRGIKWQKDFFDHLLREDENVEKHVTYILENPVRAGLTTDWKSYPYKGTMVYDFSDW